MPSFLSSSPTCLLALFVSDYVLSRFIPPGSKDGHGNFQFYVALPTHVLEREISTLSKCLYQSLRKDFAHRSYKVILDSSPEEWNILIGQPGSHV